MGTKKHVLELLENNRGQSVSGAHIAGQLNVTRNAVWKAVKELEKEGYRIDAAPNKGYCLRDDNDILSAQGMLPFLSQKEIADRINIYRSLESTSTTAKELAMSGAEHGTIVMTDLQIAGKGRYGRGFFSPPGHGIYMSFVLRPALGYWIGMPALVTASAAVAVCEAIEATTGKTPKIKWVNDVFLDGKKICGILTEAITDIESGAMQWIVVGIGVNFTTPGTGVPEDIKHIVGSVFSDGKPTITRNRLAAEIANRVLNMERNSNSETLAEYKKRLLMLGEKVIVSGLSESFEPFEATALDIDETGRLIVEKDTGETLPLSSGEISIALPIFN